VKIADEPHFFDSMSLCSLTNRSIICHSIISACSILVKLYQSSIASFGRQEGPRHHAAHQDGEEGNDTVQEVEDHQVVQVQVQA